MNHYFITKAITINQSFHMFWSRERFNLRESPLYYATIATANPPPFWDLLRGKIVVFLITFVKLFLTVVTSVDIYCAHIGSVNTNGSSQWILRKTNVHKASLN